MPDDPPFNAAPVARPDRYSLDEDSTLALSSLDGVLANDTDPEDEPLHVVLVSSTVHGTLALDDDGSFEYTPALNFFGTDIFVYQAVDANQNISNLTKVTLLVNDVIPQPTEVRVDFEDLATVVEHPISVGNMPVGYHGFTWDVWTAAPHTRITGFTRADVLFPHLLAGVHGEGAITDIADDPDNRAITVYRPDEREFLWEGVSVASLGEDQSVSLTGYTETHEVVGSITLTVGHDPVPVEADWETPIASLQIMHDGYAPLVLDDFLFLI